jgi:antitoxin component HigA of HigAB toxin-antitoxin module
MGLRPIKTDADHAAALAEIARLWDAPEGSEDEDKLEILTPGRAV